MHIANIKDNPYSHLGGAELLERVYPEINKEINQVIEKVVADRSKISRERLKKDQLLYSPRQMNSEFKKFFTELEFKPYKFKVASNGVKEVDYTKSRVNIEVQLGKYAFVYYDMVKFQYCYAINQMDVGVEIVPSPRMAKQMSSGVADGNTLIDYIKGLKRQHPIAPVKIIMVEAEDL